MEYSHGGLRTFVACDPSANQVSALRIQKERQKREDNEEKDGGYEWQE
jgi:hypothetical protein